MATNRFQTMKTNTPVQGAADQGHVNPLPKVEEGPVKAQTEGRNSDNESCISLIQVKSENLAVDEEVDSDTEYIPDSFALRDEIALKRLREQQEYGIISSILKTNKYKDINRKLKGKTYSVCITAIFLSLIFLLAFCLGYGPFWGVSERVTYWTIIGISVFIGTCICFCKRQMGIYKMHRKRSTEMEGKQVPEGSIRVTFAPETEVVYIQTLFLIFFLLCTVSLQDIGDRDSPQFPLL